MKSHIIEIDHSVEVPEDGLLLGNGDLSCSFLQRPGCLVWRLGKGDVWDRRVAYELDPKPAHIDELTRGIRDERWCCGPYGGEVKALNGAADPERMREICRGVPPSHLTRGYPCPKPAGELLLHYPPGMDGMRITQKLNIERAELEAVCRWPNGVALAVKAFIAPKNNLLAVCWRLTGYDRRRAMGEAYVPPVYFTLRRTADRPPAEYAAEYESARKPIFPAFRLGGEPMQPPTVEQLSRGRYYIEQHLPPEPTYPDGFRCGITPAGDGTGVTPWPDSPRIAALDFIPEPGTAAGELAVAVETGASRDELREKLRRLLPLSIAAEAKANRRAARRFWERSGISIPGDPLAEEAWYANLHARRIACRRGKLPPGLAFPSTVGDYSLWHGDFHMNYNFQQPFYGDYAANQPEIGDSYFEAMKPMLQMGKLIAERYYRSSGAFIQLSGYPLLAQDDLLGCAPMGRMVYATGWAGHQYLWRYQYTRDRKFLREEGYPVLKLLAQFYLDFLKEEPDGRFHAFPSNQGEDGFTGNPEAYRDLPQILLHIRFALTAAEYAAAELDADPEFRALCRDRIDRLADMKQCASVPRRAVDNWEDVTEAIDEQSNRTRPWSEVLGPRGDLFPPEFLGFDGNIRQFADPEPPAYADPDFYTCRWYAGKLPSVWLIELRNRCYRAGRDWKHIRGMLAKWRMPNGLLRAMAPAMYGFMGAYTESTGIVAPLQETLLEGYGEVIRVFPHAPPSWGDVSFRQLRAAGGFLVSAERRKGRVRRVTVKAVADGGGTVKLADPFGRRQVFSSNLPAERSNGIFQAKLRKNQVWELVCR
ncbi:hypothetical protein [Victivallis vadensis]|uniref:glycosyl hydrolase family 95 catalytic domain-containing protein n=1 Tax=Victivallis vadensis TaxID=172901 RepID=UPI00266CD35C|nr:hypothetical protein [Victivallis vadensis]